MDKLLSDVSNAAADAGPPLGEGGQVAPNGLCTVEPHGRQSVAIIGGTGYVGRLLARRLLSHPTMCLGFIVGSKRSEGMSYRAVWEEKEAALMQNYGSQLWKAMPFPSGLADVKVASLESVLESDCKIAISCVAPDVGYIEDILTNAGIKVYSISPYKRSENLTVPEVNPAQIPSNVDKLLFKSPNCVSVGTTLALKAIDDAFGLRKVSVCTFQSLSGRGDAMYPAELVQGNIYPVWNTKEKTEVYIGNEICALVNLPLKNLSVRAHRVGVHIGHFVDVRVKVRCPELLTSVDAVHQAFEAFAPLANLYGPEMPSLPKQPLVVIKEVGAPRPASHSQEFGGMQVAVGNVKLDDGVCDLCFAVVVNNMIRGAYGAALLMAEYHLYLQAHPEAAQDLIATHGLADAKLEETKPTAATSPASAVAGSVTIPAPTPTARSNKLTTAAAVAQAKAACTADPAGYHGEVAKGILHWYHPQARAWLTAASDGSWSGWGAQDAKPFRLEAGTTWTPWRQGLETGRAPFFEWFVGGQTSAAFNEVDRHVLAGHGSETAFISVPPAAFEAGIGESGTLNEMWCLRITRTQLLCQSAIYAMMLKEAGINYGDRIVFLLPHSIEQMCWIQAAKRIGAICSCLPESISISSLAGRVFEASASLAVTSSAKSTIESTSHKAMVSHAIMDYVSVEAVLRTVKRVLPEQRWRTSSSKVDTRLITEAIESSFKGDGAVYPKTVAAKLEVMFSMQPPLREKAEALASHLQEEMVREHASRVKTRMLVVPNPFSKKEATPYQVAAPPVAVPADDKSMRAAIGQLRHVNSTGERLHDLSTQQLGKLVIQYEELYLKVLPKLLEAAKVDSYDALLALPAEDLVRGVWAVSSPMPVASMHPKGIVYTSGSSGYKATGLVQDTGGYASGVANTMKLCFDATPGVDVIFTDAAPSWVTGQTYGLTGPLTMRVTSVLCTRMPEKTLAQCLAAVVKELNVSIFVASASFLKRALKNTWQAAWLQRQNLHEHLRVAASCGEPLSPAMHKVGMAVLCPNYINSYWASEHGAIIMGSSAFGNADQKVMGDASMYPLPWVDAAVWLPVGERQEDGRYRFTQAEPTPDLTPSDAQKPADSGNVLSKHSKDLKGRLVVTRPWPCMARTVWGDPEDAAREGWVGDLDTYRQHYWSTFARDDGEPVLALDLADLACPFANGTFSVLGHSREEMSLGPDRVVVAAAELESVLLGASTDVIDAVVVALPAVENRDGVACSPRADDDKALSIPIACIVLPEGVELSDELTNLLKKSAHEALGASCVPEDFVSIPAIPRTHNAKPMRNVVQRLFLAKGGGSFTEVSEIANAHCLLELKAAIDEWRFQQALPILDERC